MAQNTIVNFRNGIYQGQTERFAPRDEGIFIDDNLNLVASHWDNKLINRKTVIFSRPDKYFYGDWQNGQPQGFNTFKSGKIMMYGNYVQGKLQGTFLVVFLNENLAIKVEKTKEGYNFEKIDDIKNQDLQNIISSIGSRNKQKSTELIQFLKKNFGTIDQENQDQTIQLIEKNNCYYFGFQGGLGLSIDSTGFINSIGYTHSNGELIGVGGKYSKFSNEQGDFENKLTKKFMHNRPNKQIQKITHNSHKRSIKLINNYVKSNINQIMEEQQKFLSSEIICNIAQEQLINKIDIKQTKQSSMADIEKLKQIRSQVIKSTGTPITKKKTQTNKNNNIQLTNQPLQQIPIYMPGIEHKIRDYHNPYYLEVNRQRIYKQYQLYNKDTLLTKIEREDYNRRYNQESPYQKLKIKAEVEKYYGQNKKEVYQGKKSFQNVQNLERISPYRTTTKKDKSSIGKRYGYLRQ